MTILLRSERRWLHMRLRKNLILNLMNCLKMLPKEFKIESALDEVIKNAYENVLISNITNAKIERQMILLTVYNEINSNKDFYKYEPAEFIFGPITNGNSKFLLKYNAREMIRYLETNCYIHS